jgi:hypothetical protein
MPAVTSMKAKSLMSMSARERWRILAEESTLIVMMAVLNLSGSTDGEYRRDLNAA